MRVENYQEKNIRDYQPGESIYLVKTVSNTSAFFLCEFVSFERGLVTGKRLSADPGWAMHSTEVGTNLRVRLNKCCLYGKGKYDDDTRCHWFKTTGYVD